MVNAGMAMMAMKRKASKDIVYKGKESPCSQIIFTTSFVQFHVRTNLPVTYITPPSLTKSYPNQN